MGSLSARTTCQGQCHTMHYLAEMVPCFTQKHTRGLSLFRQDSVCLNMHDIFDNDKERSGLRTEGLVPSLRWGKEV